MYSGTRPLKFKPISCSSHEQHCSTRSLNDATSYGLGLMKSMQILLLFLKIFLPCRCLRLVVVNFWVDALSASQRLSQVFSGISGFS